MDTSAPARERTGQPEPEVVVPVVGGIPVAVGGAEVPRVVVPRAAALHAPPTVTAQPGTAVARRPFIAVVPAVLDPFPDVAMYVMQPPGIRIEAADRCRLLIVPAAAAAIAVGAVAADGVAPPVDRARARPRRIFPLGLAGEPVGQAGLAAQPIDVLLGVVPGDVDHRAVAAPPASVVGLVRAAAVGHAGIPFGEGDLVAADLEGRHPHLMRGLLIVVTRLGRAGAAHAEAAGGDTDHVRDRDQHQVDGLHAVVGDKHRLGRVHFGWAVQDCLEPVLTLRQLQHEVLALLHRRRITDTIVAALEQDIRPWHRPWNAEHVAYIQSWLKVLKQDRRAIFTAASHAQRAADFLHGLQPEPQPEPGDEADAPAEPVPTSQSAASAPPEADDPPPVTPSRLNLF